MIKCTICGREFKNPQALGGHMRGGHQEETQQDTGSDTHSGNPEDIKNTMEKTEVPGTETALVSQDTGSDIHSGNPEGIKNTVETIEEPGGETALVPEEASKAEQIRTYLKQTSSSWPVNSVSARRPYGRKLPRSCGRRERQLMIRQSSRITSGRWYARWAVAWR